MEKNTAKIIAWGVLGALSLGMLIFIGIVTAASAPVLLGVLFGTMACAFAVAIILGKRINFSALKKQDVKTQFITASPFVISVLIMAAIILFMVFSPAVALAIPAFLAGLSGFAAILLLVVITLFAFAVLGFAAYQLGNNTVKKVTDKTQIVEKSKSYDETLNAPKKKLDINITEDYFPNYIKFDHKKINEKTSSFKIDKIKDIEKKWINNIIV